MTTVADPHEATGLPGRQWEGERLHFVGVGGCGLSGLALLLLNRGARCSGSDTVTSELTRLLQANGKNYWYLVMIIQQRMGQVSETTFTSWTYRMRTSKR